MTEGRTPRPGEIRAVNYCVTVEDGGESITTYRLEQYYDGQWAPIRVYDEGEDGGLREVPQ